MSSIRRSKSSSRSRRCFCVMPGRRTSSSISFGRQSLLSEDIQVPKFKKWTSSSQPSWISDVRTDPSVSSKSVVTPFLEEATLTLDDDANLLLVDEQFEPSNGGARREALHSYLDGGPPREYGSSPHISFVQDHYSFCTNLLPYEGKVIRSRCERNPHR